MFKSQEERLAKNVGRQLYLATDPDRPTCNILDSLFAHPTPGFEFTAYKQRHRPMWGTSPWDSEKTTKGEQRQDSDHTLQAEGSQMS